MVLDLPPNVSLLVAALDLKVVQLVRDAIRTADLSRGGGGRAVVPGPAPSPEPRPRVHPDAVFEPRRHYHPTALIEPGPVLHLTPCVRYEPCPAPCADVPVGGYEPQSPPACELPFQPPWKVLPWQNPPPPSQKIKVILYRPDIAEKGANLDLFV